MKLVSALAAAALGLMANVAVAEDLKFANFMPAGHPYVAGAFQPFADMVNEKSGGDLTVVLYNGGELGPGPVEQYARVIDGVTELAISLPGYTASQFPLTLVTELPGVIKEDTGTQAIWDNIDLFKPEYKRVQLISLWSSAENILYTTEKAVRTPEDIKGMKIRVPSRNAGLQVEAWGATPVSMPVSEIYNAMQTGVIDGAMIDATATRAFKLGEVAKYITHGMKTTISPFYIIMNSDEFNGLSEKDQQALLDAGKEASVLGNKTQLTVAADGIKAFTEMEGKEVIELTAEEAAAFDALSAPVVDQVVGEIGDDAKKIVEALSSY